MENDRQAPLLSVENLRVVFPTYSGDAVAVDGATIAVHGGQILGVVGESGSGKSVLSLAIMQLIDRRHVSGRILFRGENLLDRTDRQMQAVRGRQIAMIFQEPMTSLHPTYTIGYQIEEALRAHTPLSRRAARERAVQLLRQVRIPNPESRIDAYPHQMSGGMRQRVMIAIALACSPALLIADEPTTALDVTVQAQILQLLRDIRSQTRTAAILITHDLGVIAEMADSVAVMYAGRIVETGPVRAIFDDPLHPYTIGLMASAPGMNRDVERLPSITGAIPPATAKVPGCRFHPRCPYAMDMCRRSEPVLVQSGPAHEVACWAVDQVRSAG
jgi:peptide/nickel transport system ATP-binding protein/oligopeptide transport system ATP-binding protein